MKLNRQLREFERQLEAAERHTQALRQIVEGLRALSGEQLALAANGTGNGNGHKRNGHFPKGMAAVRAIVAERPGVWTRQRLLDEFYKRGWHTTDDRERFAATVDAAIHRLRKSGEAERLGAGRYRFPVGEREGTTA